MITTSLLVMKIFKRTKVLFITVVEYLFRKKCIPVHSQHYQIPIIIIETSAEGRLNVSRARFLTNRSYLDYAPFQNVQKYFLPKISQTIMTSTLFCP